MLKTLSLLWASFKSPIIGICKVYTSLPLFLVGISFASIKAIFIRDHIVSWDRTVSILQLVIIDTFLGIWKHAKKKTLSSDGWGKVTTKVIIYWLFIKVVNHIVQIKYLEWTGDLLLSGLLVREAISIIENMGVIYPGIIPGWILKRLKQFDENGKILEEVKPET